MGERLEEAKRVHDVTQVVPEVVDQHLVGPSPRRLPTPYFSLHSRQTLTESASRSEATSVLVLVSFSPTAFFLPDGSKRSSKEK